jgi:F-type H+-transporting ATPase subunit epsilon
MVAVDKKFDLELVSPERLLLSEAVDMAVIPGAEGDLGVLAGHAPVITTLRPGIVDVYQGELVVNRLFVTGGFAEVTESRCTVLADEAIKVADIDAAAAQADIDRLTAELSNAETDDDKRLAAHRLEVAEAKLAAATRLAA